MDYAYIHDVASAPPFRRTHIDYVVTGKNHLLSPFMDSCTAKPAAYFIDHGGSGAAGSPRRNIRKNAICCYDK